MTHTAAVRVAVKSGEPKQHVLHNYLKIRLSRCYIMNNKYYIHTYFKGSDTLSRDRTVKMFLLPSEKGSTDPLEKERICSHGLRKKDPQIHSKRK